MLVFEIFDFRITLSNVSLSFFFFGITKVANLNIIWMRANNSSHRQLTSCIIRCLIADQAWKGKNLLSSVITCYSIPRLFPLPHCISITWSSLSIVIYSLYCFSYLWWCLILFFQCCKELVTNC